ncbi:MAG: putative LPS assembly protein LptD [Candidatus Kapaibacterium sp.]
MLFLSQYGLNAQEVRKRTMGGSASDTNRIFIPEAPEERGDTVARPLPADENRGGLDTTVVYFAKDSVVFDLKSKKLRLRGNAEMNYQDRKLEAEVIELYFDESILRAGGVQDTAGRLVGFPRFTEAGEEFVGEKIRFNFRSKKGVINLGETQMSEGYYFGQKIKRVSDEVLFVSEGAYTTCDAPHPHYHFGSPEMKVIAEDRVFLDPIILYVEDMPVFIIPFGLFFPSKGGRQSGLIIPNFFVSGNRGVVFENFGFYWAASDYWDTQLTADIYSKGGYMIKNTTRWNITNIMNGNGTIEYGKTRFNPDDEYTTNWQFRLYHNQTINPYEKFNVNLNFASSNKFRNTSTNLNQRITQNVTSNAAYTKNFDNGAVGSVSYQRNDNIITGDYNQSIPINYSLQNFYPLKGLSFVPSKSWLNDINVRYSVSARYSSSSTRQISTIDQGDTSIIDTNYVFNDSKLISHSPSISISPKLGYFTVSPSVNFRANNYFRKVEKKYDTEDSTVLDSYTNGFFTEYDYSLGLNISTKLFGVIDDRQPLLFLIKPSWFGAKAFRHTYNPTFGYSFAPDLSEQFYGDYYDPVADRTVQYSYYDRDGGGIASRNVAQSISYRDLHSFEVKVSQGDTIPDKNLELLRLNFAGNYNFAADSLKFSDISMGFRTPAIEFVNFDGNASFTLYDEAEVDGSMRKINEFLISEGKGVARLTSLSLRFGTSFSSQGVDYEPGFGREERDEDTLDVSLGQRFTQSRDEHKERKDIFGDSTPGHAPINLPWSINLDMIFRYNSPFSNRITRQLNISASLNFTIAEYWRVRTNARYDLINKNLQTPQIILTREMHCWDFSLSWVPTGLSRGFHLRFGIKSSQLSDLKIEKQSQPIYR